MQSPENSKHSEHSEHCGSEDRTGVDFGFWGIVAVVALTAGWVLATPWVPSVARATIERFHLRTGSFAFWAVQQPIPAMYSFANRYRVRQWPEELTESWWSPEPNSLGTIESRYINHFPVRTMTFANTRYRFLNSGEDRWLTVTSSYRGQTLETRFHVKPNDSGGFDLIRLGDRGDQP